MSHAEAPLMMNRWIPWSVASAAVPYNTPGSDAGPGEEKVAAEFGATRLGQNSPYDMDAVVNGIPRKFEIKEPDAADSFGSGRNGRDALRPIKAQIATLLLCLATVAAHPLIPATMRETLQRLSAVSPDELCEGNIVRLIEVCHALSVLRQDLLAGLSRVILINPFTGDRTEVSVAQYVATARIWGITESALIEKVGVEAFAQICLLDLLQNVYIETPDRLLADLTSLREIFHGYILVLVHKDKGYYLMESPESKITFNRITRGHPRFKVDVMERPAASSQGGRRKHMAQHFPAVGTC